MSIKTIDFAHFANTQRQRCSSFWSREYASFVAAAQILTRVPLRLSAPVTDTTLSHCSNYFPVVGGLIGISISIVLGIACMFWSIWLAVIATLAIEARLTGALHEDGVADFCDAFGGGWTRDDVLRILKDHQIGSYGALGLGIGVAIRATAIVDLIQRNKESHWIIWSSAIVASCAISRFIMVVMLFRIPSVGSHGSLSRDIGRQLTRRHLMTSALLLFPFIFPFVFLMPFQAGVCLVVLPLIVHQFMTYVRRRIGGINGDCLGCLCYGSMIVVLLAATGRWNL